MLTDKQKADKENKRIRMEIVKEEAAMWKDSYDRKRISKEQYLKHKTACNEKIKKIKAEKD